MSGGERWRVWPIHMRGVVTAAPERGDPHRLERAMFDGTFSERSYATRWARRPRPLVVSSANPGYFTVAAGDGADRHGLHLTGSHIWNNSMTAWVA